MKRVLIFGVTGQDGTLLADSLKAQGIEYLGVNRQGVIHPSGRLLQAGKLSDAAFIRALVASFAPTHIYYLSAHHHSSQDTRISQEAHLWEASLLVQVTGLVHVLEAMREEASGAKLFYASSSHIFGSPALSPQNEETPMIPDNVYGITKVTGMEACRHYYEHHGLFSSVGILYNHESIHRSEKFLSKKICRGALAIKKGQSAQLVLGDLSSRVDWGYAPDYVDAMQRILDLPHPGRYVVATGQAATVREFVELAFAELDLDYREWVKEEPSLVRCRQGSLVGDSGKLRRETSWSPTVTFPEMVRLLMAETRPKSYE